MSTLLEATDRHETVRFRFVVSSALPQSNQAELQTTMCIDSVPKRYIVFKLLQPTYLPCFVFFQDTLRTIDATTYDLHQKTQITPLATTMKTHLGLMQSARDYVHLHYPPVYILVQKTIPIVINIEDSMLSLNLGDLKISPIMKTDYLEVPKSFSTLSIHSRKHNNENYAPIEAPLVSAVNFKTRFSGPDYVISEKYIYTPLDNPTTSNLEYSLSSLEGAKHALTVSSGSACVTVLLGILEPGSHIICSNAIFAGTLEMLDEFGKKFGFTVSFVNIYDLDDLKKAIQPKTALMWIEPVSNPSMKVADVKGIAKIAKEKDVLLAVDNSFYTPYFHKPLDLGADIVTHSLTKYINGHGDVAMGCLVFNSQDLYDKLHLARTSMGIIPCSSDCMKVMRSLKTLSLRMERHGNSSLKVAHYLEKHPKVVKVLHPGLPSHPQHELFKSQFAGNTGLFSFYLKAELHKAKQFLNDLNMFYTTASFALPESIVEIPMVMSYQHVPDQFKDPSVTDNMIRISVGLEDPDDIIKDLHQAFEKL